MSGRCVYIGCTSVQVFWADVVCLDPATGKQLPGAPGPAPTPHAPSAAGWRQWAGELRPGAPGSGADAHLSLPGAAVGGAASERSALPLNSDRLHTAHARPPGIAVGSTSSEFGPLSLNSGRVHAPDLRPEARYIAPRGSASEPSALPVNSDRIHTTLHDNIAGLGAREVGPRVEQLVHRVRSEWKAELERSCLAAAAHSRGTGRLPHFAGGVHLMMRVAMEYCELGAPRVLRCVCCACCAVCAVLLYKPFRPRRDHRGAGERAGGTSRAWGCPVCTCHVATGSTRKPCGVGG